MAKSSKKQTPKEIAAKRIANWKRTGSSWLDLENLSLIQLPKSIGLLTAVEKLYLDDNRLTALPGQACPPPTTM